MAPDSGYDEKIDRAAQSVAAREAKDAARRDALYPPPVGRSRSLAELLVRGLGK